MCACVCACVCVCGGGDDCFVRHGAEQVVSVALQALYNEARNDIEEYIYLQ